MLGSDEDTILDRNLFLCQTECNLHIETVKIVRKAPGQFALRMGDQKRFGLPHIVASVVSKHISVNLSDILSLRITKSHQVILI